MHDVAMDRDAFFGDAVRILYLCSHTPEDWRAYRGDLVAFQEHLIDPWGDENLSTADEAELFILTLRIWNRAHENEPEPMPSETPGRGAVPGN